MHSDQLRRSFGAQLLDRMCVLRNNQANPQLVQGSRRDLTADQGTDSIFLGSGIPITLGDGPARILRTLGSLQKLSVYTDLSFKKSSPLPYWDCPRLK